MLQVENTLFTIVMLLYFAAMIFYFLFIAFKKDSLAKLALILQCIGFVLHTAALVCRGIGAGRLPLTNQYEFATSFAWGLCLVCLIFVLRFRFPVLGAFASPVIFLIIGYAAMQSKDVHELMPALRSNWLGFHVSTAIIAYGSFGVSFVLSLIFLLRDKMKAQGFLDQHIPQKEKLDIISYRSVSLGLLFLTFTIITGAIWAERAWGSYWSWDPKETWSLITWIIYAVYLHLRLRRGRVLLCPVYLHRRKHLPPGHSQLRITGFTISLQLLKTENRGSKDLTIPSKIDTNTRCTQNAPKNGRLGASCDSVKIEEFPGRKERPSSHEEAPNVIIPYTILEQDRTRCSKKREAGSASWVYVLSISP